MKFGEGFTPLKFVIALVKFLIPTALNVLLINFASSRAIDQGDTDWLSGLILMISMLGSAALLLDAIKTSRQVWVWQNALYLLFCGFNVYYFFKILVCCVPLVGDL